jgi:6-phosphogluconolactonase
VSVISILKDPESVLAALADFIATQANEFIGRTGKFNLALSGGSSPRNLYKLLASEAYRNRIEWRHVYFFFSDERYVPANHADSNFQMVRESLFTPLDIASEQIFAVDTTLSPAESARVYERDIVKHFRGQRCHFDLILLGLGDNSHTASLFPHTGILHEKEALVKEVFVQEVAMYRISFTAPLINLAHRVAFLVYGESKAEAVRHILEDPFNPNEYPAQLIRPESGEVYWFIDELAAKLVNGKQ